ncbi:MAG: hypothetical protein QNJ41_29140, partial [Xenococcaceae cyanobacterium MO_188.B32]|nr:hypothetical protein [Xenococcaceae cyanobacterium MO_188.B32]
QKQSNDILKKYYAILKLNKIGQLMLPFTTAYGSSDNQLTEAGCDDYLCKPYLIEELESKVYGRLKCALV